VDELTGKPEAVEKVIILRIRTTQLIPTIGVSNKYPHQS